MIFQPQIVGKPLPALTNPGTAADLRSGKQLIDGSGNVLTGTMPTQGAQTITPGIAAKTIAAGRYLTGAQTIQGDSDLVPGNIKSGVSIFGVNGILEALSSATVKLTADASATSGNTLTSSALGNLIETNAVFLMVGCADSATRYNSDFPWVGVFVATSDSSMTGTMILGPSPSIYRNRMLTMSSDNRTFTLNANSFAAGETYRFVEI